MIFGPKLGEDQKKNKKKRSSLRFSLVFGRKVGGDQKKGFHSGVVRFCLKLSAVTKGGHAAILHTGNFLC